MSSFKPNGIVTLTTDFGTHDPFVGLMKAVILGRFAQASIIDFTHEIPSYVPAAAGFWLARSWPYCTPGTVHLAVVDPGVGTARDLVLLEAAEQLFVAPDNGLLDQVARKTGSSVWRRIELEPLESMLPPLPSATFHGRDICAPLVAELAAGRLAPAAVGPVLLEKKVAERHSSAAPNQVAGQVIAVDHFGNLITDIEAAALGRLRNPRIHFRDQVFDLKRTYGDGSPGEVFAIVNSFAVVEIAQVQGNARQHFNARSGEAVLAVGD